MIKRKKAPVRLFIILIILIIVIGGISFYLYPKRSEEKQEEIETTIIISCESGDGTCPFGCPYQIDNDCEPPRTWDLVASNDPKDYLGDYIAEETFSDWRHYQPMIKRVNKLTKGLNNDLDKVKAIGNWVKHSKGWEDGTSVANRLGSIVEIFNANKGVCLDASLLTTAMLRLSGIPARSVFHPEAHITNEAYVDGKWIGFDPTFNDEKIDIYEPITPDSIYEPWEFIETTTFEYSGSTIVAKNVTFYKILSVYRDCFFDWRGNKTLCYGYVKYPHAGVNVYAKEELFNDTLKFTDFSLIKNEEYDSLVSVQCWLQRLNTIFCNSLWCEYHIPWLEMEGKQPEYLGINIPSSFYATFFSTTEKKYLGKSITGKQGSIRASSIEGQYKMICGFDPQGPNAGVAYTEFEIKGGEETVITADSFKKMEDAKNEQFELLIKLFR
jgi:hypothetical protein